jgi:hypothetical protein
MSAEDPPLGVVLDGNAVAGLLRAVFGTEMTTASGICAHCGNEAPLAELMVFMGGPGVVLRCRVCVEVVVRIAETPKGTFIDIRGATHLRMP